MLRFLLVISLLSLAACASGEHLATVSGPCAAMNIGQWAPPSPLPCPAPGR